jgi:hypothetical protein
MTESKADDILDDLFHGCAFAAYVELAVACRGVPDQEATRQLASTTTRTNLPRTIARKRRFALLAQRIKAWTRRTSCASACIDPE